MKNIVVKSNNFELGRAALDRPILQIGRSPDCDIVLRAPHIQPNHFVLKWEGLGEFNPEEAKWILVDSTNNTSTEITDREFTDKGFQFTTERVSFYSNTSLGKNLQSELHSNKEVSQITQITEKLNLLEIVWTKIKTGRIENIVHLSLENLNENNAIFKALPQFKISKAVSESGAKFKILLDKFPEPKLYCKGEVKELKEVIVLPSDIWTLESDDDRLDIKLVVRNEKKAIPSNFIHSDFIQTSVFSSFLFVLLLLSAYFSPNNTAQSYENLNSLPRVVQILIKDETPPVKEETLPPPDEVTSNSVKVNVMAETQTRASINKEVTIEKAAAAASPHYKTENTAPRVGLNSPAPKAQLNQIGVLGLLNKNKSTGRGVKAELLINQGFQSDAVTSNNGDAKLIIKNPPSGIIGSGLGGNTRSTAADMGVLVASTTQSGGGKVDPTSLGAIARKGGASEWATGNSLQQGGTGIGAGSVAGFGDDGNIDVAGGLDRETVRRVISGYRGRIRVCYDKALVTNPQISGRITNKWTISSSGPVADAHIIKSAVSSNILENCILDVVKNMLFPKAPNGRTTTVIYPFEFMAK